MSNVTVGCKLPNGIWLGVGDHKPVRINGWNNNMIQGAGHGLTEDVPADLWDAWVKEHAESKLVTGGFIFAVKSEREAKAKARGNKDNKSGHEQLDQVRESDKAGVLAASDEK